MLSTIQRWIQLTVIVPLKLSAEIQELCNIEEEDWQDGLGIGEKRTFQ